MMSSGTSELRCIPWAWYGVIPENFTSAPGSARRPVSVSTPAPGGRLNRRRQCLVRGLQDVPAVLSARTQEQRGQSPCRGHRAPGHWAPSDQALPLSSRGSPRPCHPSQAAAQAGPPGALRDTPPCRGAGGALEGPGLGVGPGGGSQGRGVCTGSRWLVLSNEARTVPCPPCQGCRLAVP